MRTLFCFFLNQRAFPTCFLWFSPTDTKLSPQLADDDAWGKRWMQDGEWKDDCSRVCVGGEASASMASSLDCCQTCKHQLHLLNASLYRNACYVVGSYIGNNEGNSWASQLNMTV
ncbi:hypothetical protein P153DRAFT_12297 [Dothidotthia symphoricarpi CBS 119687]|uniref:Uncharacterized protein n=1 Tax=Dothidotthia symphoricarpi CBS 119687 TaxID=1392245 RepID=A0A6A6AVC6_9PLEO|nr:uncharacterized protein P153DRAFT_12297 [Dothidotthia symphoricarpi CBS 119687]KAF2134904.1 hypothetical protein P153DRAFT_12297 [Dothidotthia symphoricarpi CBS 119687]